MIENVAKSLRLPIETQEPSMNALYWYGNTSSSSIWYAAGWAETVKGIKKGERMMQLGLGAGFESNASVWRALRDIDTPHNAWKHVLGGAEGEAKDVFMRVCRGEATGSSTLLIKQDIMVSHAH